MAHYRLVEYDRSGRAVSEAFDAPSDDEAIERVVDVAEGWFELWRGSVLVATNADPVKVRAAG